MITKRDKRIDGIEKPKVLFWSLLLIIVLAVFSYGYLVRAAIVNIVDRQTLEKDILALSSRVLSLESEYVKAKNDITAESAKNHGFISNASTSQKFVTKASTDILGLSVNVR